MVTIRKRNQGQIKGKLRRSSQQRIKGKHPTRDKHQPEGDKPVDEVVDAVDVQADEVVVAAAPGGVVVEVKVLVLTQ